MTAAPRDRQRRREALTAVAARLGPDELELVLLLARRLRIGQRRYGRLDVERDGRNFRREALEEVADALVYAGCALTREGPGRSRRSSEDRAPAASSDALRAAADALRAVQPAPQGPQENGQLLGRLRRSDDEEVHVTWVEWRDRLHLGLRLWRLGRDARWFPDRQRGLLIHLDELPAFCAAVATAADLAHAHLVAHPAPPAVPDAPASTEAEPATAPPTRRRRRKRSA